MGLKARINFHICKYLADKRLNKYIDKECVYLTFDDGPEPGITEFVLDELKQYGFEATFFCCGNNLADNKNLAQRIINEGHTIANHTFSHVNGLKLSDGEYFANIEAGAVQSQSDLFRPPWGGASLKQYLRLRKKYEFVYWDIISGDAKLQNFDLDESVRIMKNSSLKGKIILFHFSKKHEKETRIILPVYLKYLHDCGLQCKKL